MDTHVVSRRLSVHPSDVRNAVEGWYERLPAVLGSGPMRVESRFWLATKGPHEASSDPLELYRVRGVLWMFGRPIRVTLEFSIWSNAVSQVALRPAKLTWPVCTERYGRRAAQVLEDVAASLISQTAPRIARPCEATPHFVSDLRPLRGFSTGSAVLRARPCTLPNDTDTGVTMEMIARSPCRGVRPPADTKLDITVLSAQEVTELAAAMPEWSRSKVWVAAYTGLRWSEMVGMQRRDIDLLRRTMSVRRQIVEVGSKFERFGEPKTAVGPAQHRPAAVPL